MRRSRNLPNDVKVFLTKTGINDDNIANALLQCHYNLVNSGLWSKIKVFYPMVGGTAFTTKFDLVRKNNSYYDITWNGSPIFTANGVNGGAGLNACGRTEYRPIVDSILGNEGYTTCVGTNDSDISSDPIYLGAFSAPTDYSLMTVRTTEFNFCARLNNTRRIVSNTTKIGVYSINRILNTLTMLKNSNVLLTNAADGGLSTSYFTLLNAGNGNGIYANGYSTGRMQSTLIHEALTNSETATLHEILNTFESTLNRKTW